MTEEQKAMVRIAALLAAGLGPTLAALLVSPSRGGAVAAAGSTAMAVAFVLWTSRLAADAHQLRIHESAVRSDLSSLKEKFQAQTRELREARANDEVTGVSNRITFLQRLDEAIARDARLGKALVFLLIDIEGFKAINIERGRIGGDAILKGVAEAICGATRGTDCVGRLGGDEFGVALNECEDPRPAVNRIFLALQAAGAGDGAAKVHVAVGAVTIENPAAGVELPELFRLAEDALAAVRGTGSSLCAHRTLRGESSAEAASA